MVVPGAFLGMGAHLASPTRSVARGVVMGLAALGLGFFLDIRHSAPPADEVRYYFTHLSKNQLPLAMIVLGGFLGFLSLIHI